MKMTTDRESGETAYHLSVMAEEVVHFLIVDPLGLYLDATLGGGGHAADILDKLGPAGGLIGLDRDMEAVLRNQTNFAGESRISIRHAAFSRLREFCPPESLAGALFDLGVSSRQLDAGERGFSFSPGTPLDMRMGQGEGATAADMLRTWDDDELAAVLRANADIIEARRLARYIKSQISETAEPTSDALRRAVERLPGIRGDKRNQLLARVFQAVRMEVNCELGEIETGLSDAVTALRKGGRMCILSYHSVEDRKVKETLASFERDCLCPPELPVCRCGGGHRQLKKVLRKPGLPTAIERARNPRARSAKLRVMEKT